MARLLSFPVLAGTVVASPALWAALVDGTMPLETALVRLAVAVAAAWLGLSLVSALVEATSPPRTPASPPPGSDLDSAPLRAAVVEDRRT